jgi:hypothetical protein
MVCFNDLARFANDRTQPFLGEVRGVLEPPALLMP